MDWIIVLVVLPFVIGYVGNLVKLAVLGQKPWDEESFNWFQRAYRRSLAWHPVFVALPMWIAFCAFRWPRVFGDNPIAYVLVALFSSGLAIIGYHLIVRTLRGMISGAGALVGTSSRRMAESVDEDGSPAKDGETDERP